MACEILAHMREGFYIRAFECSKFNTRSRGSPAWNVSLLEETMGADFEPNFLRCCTKQLEWRDRRRGWGTATSFLRHDLPVKSYADKFGFMIHGNESRVNCAYAFDSYKGWGVRRPCKLSVEEMVKRRRTRVASACRMKPGNNFAGVWAQKDDAAINCCHRSVRAALETQRQYASLPHPTKCVRGNGLNQMQLQWSRDDVFGVYYVQDQDARHARRMHAIAEQTTGRQLQFCQLPFSEEYKL